MQKKLKSVCEQLIQQRDLVISDEISKELSAWDMTLQICKKRECEIKIYSKRRIAISDIVPILGDFGFTTISEITYEADGGIFVTKLMLDSKLEGLLVKNSENIKDVLLRVLGGEIERGKLLGLVYLENFSAKEILLSRAFGNYAQQLIDDFNKSSLEDCIIRYHGLYALFLEYILTRFDPTIDDREKKVTKIEEDISKAFKEVESINDDRALKVVYEILQAVVRTNYFSGSETLALKFDVSSLAHILKGVQPKYETFVYAHDMQGTHLRISKVCRGGIRWSNRDDFRTEIRSLMATQEAKNAIIVPKGAKGGFIINKKDITKEEFESYYSRFINALLDVVDNQKDGQVLRDKNSVIYDGDDPYFVVAADRGTSSMSDRANSIAITRGFWLKDAFASGSSNGYHHKRLGVTAKGAIRATQRFFIQKGVDFYKESISIVGVGSMSGDVFGNGMLESEKFKLIAAISHSDIFIDPNPDVNVAYLERKRLFEQKSGWASYDKSKISKGGGVFKRSSKSIALTPEIQGLIGTKKASLNGEELAKEFLKLKVDMLYFGGIGTYVKSSNESNISLGDKENEFVRIDADEIRADVVCEGANLALTMLARIEYSLNGGEINLDSIDNSAGVDTSDREVNLKILLNSLVDKGMIDEDEKNSTLKGLSKTVVNSVLWTNYLQSLSISLDEIRSLTDMDSFKSSLMVLEKNLSVFQRRYFNIPKDRDFDEVIDSKGRLIRPVIATMTLYAKILLQELLCECNMYEEDSFFDRYLFKYFPKSLIAIYEDEIREHPLKKEITSMIIANKIINHAGATFVKDLESLGREKFLLKIKAYLATNQLYDANDIRYEIYRGDYDIEVSKQYKMLLKIEDEIEYNARWIVKSMKKEEISFSSILEYKSAIKDLINEFNISSQSLLSSNKMINSFFTNLDFLKYSSTIIKIKQNSHAEFRDVAILFYALIQKFEVALLMDSIQNISAKNSVQEILKTQIKQLLEYSLIDMTKELLLFRREDEDIDDVIENYLKHKEFDTKEYKKMIEFIKNGEHISMSDLSFLVNYLLLSR
jgi:glutamate dehydrogenase